MYQNTILFRNNLQKWSTTNTDWNATPNNKGRNAIILWYNKLCEKVLTFDSRGVQTTEEIHIIKSQLDMEQHLSKPTQKSKNYHQKNVTMTFYNKKDSQPITYIAKNIAIHSPTQHKNAVPGWLQLLIADWLFRHNHKTDTDKEIPCICVTINAISCMDTPDCMKAEATRLATLDDEHLGMLSEYVLHGWPSTKAELQKEPKPYWSFWDETVITDGITLKGKYNSTCITTK